MLIELDPVDRITADAVGPPGERVFYLQGRKGRRLVTLLVEKQQVQLLAASVIEILSQVGKETGEGPGEDTMGLEEPVVPEWRAGRLSIGYQEERDLVLLEAEELVSEEGNDDEGEEPEETAGVETGVVSVEPEAGDLAGDGEETSPAPEESVRDAQAEMDELSSIGRLEREMGEERDPERVRFWATREQMLALARHGAAVCAAGRPRCQFCRAPLDPDEEHRCPAMDGHREFNA